jgi:peptidoglycan hydrolase-like protein with peptidoglycan-binding domain
MESLAYLHLALAQESPSELRIFQGLNGQKLSGKAYLFLLRVALIISIILIANAALADMQFGDSGNNVKILQQRLRDFGYFSTNGNITGNFSQKTLDAVKRFQHDKGLTPDGIVGSQTLGALGLLTSSSYNPNIPNDNPIAQNVLTIGSRGQEVSNLQQNLAQLGYLDPIINVTGLYDNRTRLAVQHFQQDYRLRNDGYADAATLNAINVSLSQRFPPVTPDNIPPSNNLGIQPGIPGSLGSLMQGDTGSQVEELQQRLKQLDYFRENITAYFGPKTEDAVKRFQRDRGLPITGIADPNTIATLRNYTTQVVQPTTTQPLYLITLRRGNSSWGVQKLQTRLNSLGYYTGEFNGNYGPGTEYAVLRFQQDHYLTPTGVSTPETQSKLESLTTSISLGENSWESPFSGSFNS